MPMLFWNLIPEGKNKTERGFQTMSTKSAALEKEMQARTTKPKKWLRFYRCIPLYLMFLPGALYLLMDKYLPMTGLIIAFKRVNWRKGILASDWVGFSNFTYLFKTKDAVTITRNTVLYNVAFIVLGTVLAICLLYTSDAADE